MSKNHDRHMISRRDVIRGIGALGTLSLIPSLAQAASSARTHKLVPLPSADMIRRDYQHMVDFGPRLPGHPNHVRFVNWMAADFQKSGLTLGPCDSYDYERWDPLQYGLEIEDGSTFKAVPKVAYYVRSAPTGAEGVSGPLVYGGSITADGTSQLGDIPKGSIVVFDGKLPVTTVRKMVDPHYVHGHQQQAQQDAYLDSPYKRLWLTPAYPLETALAKGAAAVVIIMDVSSDMIQDNFSPHARPYKPPLPALFVGQDTGEEIRRLAKLGTLARLTLNAQWVRCDVPSLTAVLPGESDEVMIIDTHTDGQNFIEENGCITMVQLARHFASLPKHERLRRTLVFVGWPGHMTGKLPECAGWLRAHPDLVKRAAAAFTIEHLGAPEWEDIPGKGYGPTGRNEYMNFATTGGLLNDWVKDGFEKFNLREHGIQAGPGITTGAVFHKSGVPHVGVIGGPNYLLGVVKNGHMDKLDADLACRQTAMIAELIKRADRASLAQLRTDKSLGADPVVGPDESVRSVCLPVSGAKK